MLAALPHLGWRLWTLFAIVFLASVVVLLANILLRDEEAGPIGFARELLASPANVVQENLVGGEQILNRSRPAIAAFLIKETRLSLQTFAVMILWILIAYTAGLFSFFGLIAFLVFDSHVLYLLYRRAEDLFTLYVFTNQRVMKASGIFNRDLAVMEWDKVVDYSWKQSFNGRLFGYATLRVDSASEKASLSELRDIPSRSKVNQILIDALARRER